MSSARAAAYKWPMVPQKAASALLLLGASVSCATRGGDGSIAAAPTPGASPTICVRAASLATVSLTCEVQRGRCLALICGTTRTPSPQAAFAKSIKAELRHFKSLHLFSERAKLPVDARRRQAITFSSLQSAAADAAQLATGAKSRQRSVPAVAGRAAARLLLEGRQVAAGERQLLRPMLREKGFRLFRVFVSLQSCASFEMQLSGTTTALQSAGLQLAERATTPFLILQV